MKRTIVIGALLISGCSSSGISSHPERPLRGLTDPEAEEIVLEDAVSQAWSQVLPDRRLRQHVTTANDFLATILAGRGWPMTLVESLQPLHVLPLLSPYEHLDVYFPDAELVADPEMPGLYLLESGLILIGFCPNGDFIAVDAEEEVGAVVYVSHEEFDYEDLALTRSITLVVAPSVSDYLLALQEGTAPLDYWEIP